MMKSVKEFTESRIVIEKSEFISFIYPITSSDEAKEIIKNTRKEFYDATHVVYAYVLDNEAHSSDDNEPKGTAGVPTLEVLRKNDLVNVLGITIRYFGGIKLGAGGLVRAYTKSISECLKNAPIIYERMVITFDIVFSYKHLSFIEKKIKDALEISKDFSDNIKFTISMTTEDYQKFIESLSPLSMNYSIENEIIERKFL